MRTARGDYAVKLFPAGLTEDRRRQLLSGIQFEHHVLREDLVPAPRAVGTGAGWLVEWPSSSGVRLARCHEWVHGTPAHRPLPLEVISAAGRYLGILHAMRWPGGDTAQLPPMDLHRWYRTVLQARDADMGWADQLDGLTPLVEELAADVDVLRAERRPMQISHRDYDPKNAIIDEQGQLVIADWDYAGPVLPGVELVVAATSFADSDDHVVAFVQAYRRAGGIAEAADALGMTAELADLDWLLRNVEASIHDENRDAYSTTSSLITSLADDVIVARSWPRRLSELLVP